MEAEVISSERVDHLGIVAGAFKELDLVAFIDKRIGRFQDETITVGESIMAMVINGLGFTDRPISLVPQYFENCPLGSLFREGLVADNFNRFKLS
jgi:transposase